MSERYFISRPNVMKFFQLDAGSLEAIQADFGPPGWAVTRSETGEWSFDPQNHFDPYILQDGDLVRMTGVNYGSPIVPPDMLGGIQEVAGPAPEFETS